MHNERQLKQYEAVLASYNPNTMAGQQELQLMGPTLTADINALKATKHAEEQKQEAAQIKNQQRFAVDESGHQMLAPILPGINLTPSVTVDQGIGTSTIIPLAAWRQANTILENQEQQLKTTKPQYNPPKNASFDQAVQYQNSYKTAMHNYKTALQSIHQQKQAAYALHMQTAWMNNTLNDRDQYSAPDFDEIREIPYAALEYNQAHINPNDQYQSDPYATFSQNIGSINQYAQAKQQIKDYNERQAYLLGRIKKPRKTEGFAWKHMKSLYHNRGRNKWYSHHGQISHGPNVTVKFPAHLSKKFMDAGNTVNDATGGGNRRTLAVITVATTAAESVLKNRAEELVLEEQAGKRMS